ncbi:hypothetical protein AX769_06010 [Frondihabitans sp. PAMC 28766]|uniref:DarT ssDNA thymidine ADP-ribosyltransferase family protein n=1 Tax=Frondihabitans sp. PAMC 28766 TaxID=1795630 RepID=UPI00078DA014|nr:DarT ssDNA thymidine ADP-ribosyltransferase family protein [Frondihabitans sp. PAMC 28766]AMM19787.1 hypothetical protein AX769_06010 [Frondihabitans sp. PAMC 28766]
MIECIHGLDIELCDICSPRQTPESQEPTSSSTSTPTVRKAPATRRTPPRVAGVKRPPAADALPNVDLSTMRAHHWTHIDNLEGILSGGLLRAAATPEIDVSSAAHREKRAAAVVPSGASVASHVPFALSPDATTWNQVRTGAAGDRWSAAARETRATDYVVLVAPIKLLGSDFVVADGDAADALTRFAQGPAEGAALVRRASIADPTLLNAEILVPDSVDLMSVTLIGVPNDRMRDRVKALVTEAGGSTPRVAIYPPWFRPAED